MALNLGDSDVELTTSVTCGDEVQSDRALIATDVDVDWRNAIKLKMCITLVRTYRVGRS